MNVEKIHECLMNDTPMEKIKIRNRPRILTGSDTEAIADALKKWKVKKLSLFRTDLGPADTKVLASALKKNCSLKVLKLSNINFFIPEGTAVLADALKNHSSLEKIELEYNWIGPNDTIQLADAFMSIKTLKFVNLSNNDINLIGTIAMAGVLKKNKLEKLNLSSNYIGSDGAAVIANVLRENETLKELVLGRNNIGPRGARLIFEALKVNNVLTKLHLPYNKIVVNQSAPLVDMLKKNEVSMLDNVGITYPLLSGIGAMSGMLYTNRTLKYLNLHGNYIGTENAELLVSGLLLHTSLEQLDLGDTLLTLEGIKMFDKVVEKYPSLNIELEK